MKPWLIAGIIAILLIIVFWIAGSQRSEDISNPSISLSSNDVTSNGGYRAVSADGVPGAARELSFSFSVFENWQAEAVGGGALSIYDPLVEAATTLEKAKIFIKFFRANDFQKPDAFNILSRQDQELNGRAAVSYVISKKEGATGLAGEPSWRNKTHRSVDIRLRPENPSLFFVFAKSPDLSETEFQRFLKSIQFN